MVPLSHMKMTEQVKQLFILFNKPLWNLSNETSLLQAKKTETENTLINKKIH
jgi:hypothetical protein